MSDPRPGSRWPLLVLAVGVPVVAGVLAGLWLLGRANSDEPAATATPTTAASGAPMVEYELRPEDRPVMRVRLEVAATPDARGRGLSRRTSVPDGSGMVFLFPGDTDTPFWMKDTLVPLSIAFVDADGRVVTVREMVPCEADPCQLYEPEAPYRSAVELPAGAFDRAGVGPGDLVVPVAPDILPDPS
jgi:uncharacterized membrane protein (UPF0127 family)